MVPEADSREVRDLQSGINDLVSVLAFPALWSGRDAGAIVRTLVDRLLDMLRLDIVYARLNPIVDGLPTETMRVAHRRGSADHLADLAQAIAAAIDDDTQAQGCRSIADPLGTGHLSVAVCRLGAADEVGVVAAASSRPGFPTQMEMLLLQVAANQAAIGLHEARRLYDQSRELGRAISERNQIETERRRLASLVEHSPDFIGLAAFDGHVWYVNPAGQRIVGIDGDARVRATTIDEFVLADERARVHSDILPTLQREGRWEGELHFRHFQTGAAIPMLHQVFVIDEPDTDYPVIATISRDITQRKRAEAELLALKDELASELVAMIGLHDFSTRLLASTDVPPLLAEVLDAVVSLQNADFGMVQLYNPHTDTLTIVDQRGFSAATVGRLSGEPDARVCCERALKSGARVIIEDIHDEPACGSYRAMAAAAGFRAVQSTPLFSRAGEPLGVISTHFRVPHRPSAHELRLTDLYCRQVAEMIERKRSEDALRRSEAALAEGQRISQTGTWALSLSTGEVLCSQEHLRILDYPPDQARPSFPMFLERIHPEDRLAVQQAIHRSIRERSNFEMDYRVLLPNGSVKYLHSMGRPVAAASGELTEFVGTVMDNTERTRADEALRVAQAELTRVARVLTMGELTASIAHEVNQPLAGVVVNGHACLRWLAHESPNLDEARNAVQRIINDGMRASEVVARIRALVRKTGTETEPLDVNDVVQEVVTLTAGEVRRHEVLLHIELAPEPLPVLGDRVQLQQVLINLIINGIEAMTAADGHPRDLTVGTAVDQDDVLVAVRDSGIGITDQNLEHLFEAFFTTKTQGMGIGLSISRSIIESHHGRLWVTRNDDRGVTFRFVLPRLASH